MREMRRLFMPEVYLRRAAAVSIRFVLSLKKRVGGFALLLQSKRNPPQPPFQRRKLRQSEPLQTLDGGIQCRLVFCKAQPRQALTGGRGFVERRQRDRRNAVFGG